MTTVSVVTGANSGIGRATAIHLAQQGHQVVGTVREVARATKLQAMAADGGVDIPLVELDVADDVSVEKGFAEISDRFGPVDVLVNNAGVGTNGTVEDTSTAAFLDVMNVNLCGAVRCLQQVLPSMRERRSGAIVNVTSVAGRFGSPAQAPYVASKWAFEGLSEELALELASFGIRVVIIEPGVTKSAIFAKNVDTPDTTGAYDMQYRRLFDFYAAGLAQATDPFEVAALIHHAVTTDEPKLRYACSWGGREIVDSRPSVSDHDWLSLGGIDDDTEYRAAFQRLFAVDITPPPT
jgi:NAD(P)-dependent dehydrogenase (short-subunit alcohol dehydrogenase family)